ncbi:hypothetical protein LSCM1_08223 [Leishmania martiniquensis]|uniref:Proteasome assembly chaperone 3 n=1 Tax=Leishmania martiniquensis TaxID=1580590 RepID=A0A836HUK6_9TRYP|nr:hypothetical protein LSCM1_08223 [Leishmania martiniquensis]
MPAPRTTAVRVPFYFKATESNAGVDPPADGSSEPETPVFVTNAFIELVTFDDRFFWLHISESPTRQSVPRLGACSVAVGLQLKGDGDRVCISSSQLMEFDTAHQQDISVAVNSNAQSVLATSLSQRLVRGIAKQLGIKTTVYVNCAIDGERCLELLGTDGGSGFDMTFQFGALLYRESLQLISQQCGASLTCQA